MSHDATYSFRVLITAGAEKNGSGELLSGVPHRLMSIQKTLAKQNGGYTETLNRGGWINQYGDLVEEEAYTWTMIVQDTVPPEVGAFTNAEVAKEKGYVWAEFIKDTLDQSSVMLTIERVKTVFV